MDLQRQLVGKVVPIETTVSSLRRYFEGGKIISIDIICIDSISYRYGLSLDGRSGSKAIVKVFRT
ncbi:two component sensor histidine kinase FecR/PupR [Anopheles sinensis]|uniref:Two component sensor histidine kinase FecR/PupR n=1 Tax=Anopheles sinensis TaxID=74873 RepID=A0A084WRR5_ANOSI|nr:two component sensor histidine kinase FecR/PupR [Anopheles sinensis]